MIGRMKDLTLGIIKPDAYEHRIAILDEIRRVGIGVRVAKTLMLKPEQVRQFYRDHEGKPFFDELVTHMSRQRMVVLALDYLETKTRGLAGGPVHIVDYWRAVIGATDPKKAAPDTIRARFGTGMPANAVHGSATIIDAAIEIPFFFAGFELGDAR